MKVPFGRELYISSGNIVGAREAERNENAVKIVGVGCDMTDFFGIVDTQIRKVGEHNIRLMGFSRLNIMRSKFRGQHYSGGKQKLTIRACVNSTSRSTLNAGRWQNAPDVDLERLYADIGDPSSQASAPYVVNGRVTREIAAIRSNGNFVKQSRYQVLHANQIGDASAPLGSRPGSTKYQTNALSGDEELFSDIILSENIFENDRGSESGDWGGGAGYTGCFNNTYTGDWSRNCLSPDPFAGDPDNNLRPFALDYIQNVRPPSL